MKEEGFIHLALGDSYTIGEAVNVDERWPVQLAKRLRKDSIKIDPVIVATTGWTTDELKSGIVKADLEGTYDFVTVLIGVNNQYRGYPIDQYEREFKEILDQAIQFTGGNPYNVMVISIPDYGATPFASKRLLDAEKIARELDQHNAIAEKIAKLRGVKFINITPGSKQAKNDPSLIASDGLHPSGKMYETWVDAMYDHVYSNLSSR
ncbi:MAG: SGNH/GDSL hydrolase family protein [Ekhidna sp.]|uniref:SGNH/GDSL hydrolase family protein n=1 Tax=Ekhidna sp. TaxID=2608089 RepID=UPI0032ED939C